VHSWGEFATEAPEVAEAGQRLLHQFGPGLGFLATVRADGAPRVHPVCPVLAEGGLWVFVVNGSPKVHDLGRDGRFALHSFPAEDRDDEFCCSGVATAVDDPDLEARVLEVYLAQGTTTEDHTLFELRVDRALHVPYGPRPSPPLGHHRWNASV
jgi:hypothetical protein